MLARLLKTINRALFVMRVAMYACHVTTSDAANVMAQVKKMQVSSSNGSCRAKNATERGGLRLLQCVETARAEANEHLHPRREDLAWGMGQGTGRAREREGDTMISIYEAEIRHKPWAETVEDQLTSRVFGTLAMLPEHTVLRPFLRCLAEDVALPENKSKLILSKMKRLQTQSTKYEKISLDLWKYTGVSYPDVYIELDDIVIVMEVKKNSKLSTWQIVDQYRNTKHWLDRKTHKYKFAYFLLSGDDTKPREIGLAQERLQREFPDAEIYWIRWSQIWRWFTEISRRHRIDAVGKELLDATIKLMEAENMSGPTGFKKEWFDESLTDSLAKMGALCQEISATMREVKTRAENNGIELFDDSLSPPKSKDRLHNPDEWIHRYFDFYFRDQSWKKVTRRGADPSLYISFWLESESPGVDVGLWWESPDEDDKEAIVEEVRFKTTRKEPSIDETSLANEGELAVFYSLAPKSLTKGGPVVDILMDRLIKMRNFAESIEALQKYLKYRRTTRRRREK